MKKLKIQGIKGKKDNEHGYVVRVELPTKYQINPRIPSASCTIHVPKDKNGNFTITPKELLFIIKRGIENDN